MSALESNTEAGNYVKDDQPKRLARKAYSNSIGNQKKFAQQNSEDKKRKEWRPELPSTIAEFQEAFIQLNNCSECSRVVKITGCFMEHFTKRTLDTSAGAILPTTIVDSDAAAKFFIKA
jgi:hypothetical protein